MNKTIGTLAATALLACILLANWVTTEQGLIPVGFGLTATAGTYFAGATFVLRDTVQNTTGRRAVMGVIIAGALLSYAAATWIFTPGFLPPGVTAQSIAVASAIAFLVSETVDFAVYTPLQERGYVRAAIASNVAGTIVDTLLFLWISGFGITSGVVEGQLVGKLAVTAVVVALVLGVRGVVSRQSVRA